LIGSSAEDVSQAPGNCSTKSALLNATGHTRHGRHADPHEQGVANRILAVATRNQSSKTRTECR
jgi:hypothetical protein